MAADKAVLVSTKVGYAVDLVNQPLREKYLNQLISDAKIREKRQEVKKN